MLGKKRVKRNIFFEFEENWKYVKTEEDINEIMFRVGGFHDGVIETINYTSGSYGTKEGGSSCFNTRNDVSVIIAGCWDKTTIFKVELLFEGVREMNLRPAQANYVSLFDGSVFLENGFVCFADEININTIKDYKYTYIVAEKLKYRRASK